MVYLATVQEYGLSVFRVRPVTDFYCSILLLLLLISCCLIMDRKSLQTFYGQASTRSLRPSIRRKHSRKYSANWRAKVWEQSCTLTANSSMSQPVLVPPFIQNIPKQGSSRERGFPTMHQYRPHFPIMGHMHASTLQFWGHTASCCHSALLFCAKAALPIHKATGTARSKHLINGRLRWLSTKSDSMSLISETCMIEGENSWNWSYDLHVNTEVHKCHQQIQAITQPYLQVNMASILFLSNSKTITNYHPKGKKKRQDVYSGKHHFIISHSLQFGHLE